MSRRVGDRPKREPIPQKHSFGYIGRIRVMYWSRGSDVNKNTFMGVWRMPPNTTDHESIKLACKLLDKYKLMEFKEK